MTLPSHVASRFLVKMADQVKVLKLFDYTIIVNNFNPLTLCYDDTNAVGYRFVWVYHKSFGRKLDRGIQAARCSESINLNSLLKSTLLSAPPTGSYSKLPSDMFEGREVVDLNAAYSVNMVELLRLHLQQYPHSLCASIEDQTNQEQAVIQEFSARQTVPWQIMEDIEVFKVDQAEYRKLLAEVPHWLKAILVKILR